MFQVGDMSNESQQTGRGPYFGADHKYMQGWIQEFCKVVVHDMQELRSVNTHNFQVIRMVIFVIFCMKEWVSGHLYHLIRP